MTKGWRTGRLIDFASVSTGPFGSLLHKSDYVSDGVPLVNPINIVSERIVPNPDKRIDRETVSRLAPYILRQGDIVVSRRGELGRCAAIGRNESGWVCGTGCFFIRPGNDIEPRFLAAMLRSERYRSELENASTGATMPSISNTTLSDLLITVPERREQQRIVAILDEAFAGIATAKANAEKNLQNARKVFALGVFKLFARETNLCKLGAVCGFENGDRGKNYPGKQHRVSIGVPFINAGHLTDQGIDFSEMDYISEDRFNLLGNGKICANDILFCLRGSLGKFASVGALDKGAIASSLVILRPKQQLENDYLLAFLSSRQCREQIDKFKGGAAQPNLGAKDLKQFSLPLLPIQAQQGVARRFGALREETQRLESLYHRKLAALDELKQSLLHQAFRARCRNLSS